MGLPLQGLEMRSYQHGFGGLQSHGKGGIPLEELDGVCVGPVAQAVGRPWRPNELTRHGSSWWLVHHHQPHRVRPSPMQSCCVAVI